MTEVAETTENELLVESLAKRDWLRDNPTGMLARSTERRAKEIERELQSRGVDAEAPKASRRAAELEQLLRGPRRSVSPR